LECLKYGADFVWTEELIDVKLSTCQRIENHRLNTVDFLLEKDTTVRPVFQTCESEKPFVILQLGTSNPEEALKAAKLVEKDVAAIEVNMGCPKEYSTKAGMGAALLSTPDLAAAILDKLVKNLSIPVTAKIRCLSNISETVNFCDKLAKTGISLLSIHGRQRPERPRHPVRLEWITEVRKQMKTLHPNLPIWVNGVSFTPLDSRKSVDNILSDTNCNGIMIARAAFRNPSIFAEKLLCSTEVTRSYIETALKYETAINTIKYIAQEMLVGFPGEPSLGGSEIAVKLRSSQTINEVAEIWNIEFNEILSETAPQMLHVTANSTDESTYSLNLAYNKKLHICERGVTPKQLVNDIFMAKTIASKGIKIVYKTSMREADNRFQSKLEIAPSDLSKFKQLYPNISQKAFSSTYWDRNKKLAEQSTSVVFLKALDLI